MGLGILGLATAGGAGQGLEAVLKRRLMEQQMQQQAAQQAEEMALRRASLDAETARNTAMDTRNDLIYKDQQARLGKLDARQQTLDRNAAAADASEQLPAGSAVPDVMRGTPSAGRIRAIPMMGEKVDTGAPADPLEFLGMSKDERTQAENQAFRAETAAATASERERIRTDENKREDRQRAENQNFQAGIVKLAADLRESGKATAPAKPPTGAQQDAARYFRRGNEALDGIEPLEDAVSKMGLLSQIQAQGPNILQNDDMQSYRAKQRAFTEARLRKESGAAVPESEYISDAKTYFAQPGDSAKTLATKRRGRAEVLLGLGMVGKRALVDYYGDEEAVTAALNKWRNDGTTAKPSAQPSSGRVYYDANGNPVKR